MVAVTLVAPVAPVEISSQALMALIQTWLVEPWISSAVGSMIHLVVRT